MSSRVVAAHLFKVPYYVCKMQRREGESALTFYNNGTEEPLKRVLDLAARVAPLHLCEILISVQRRVARTGTWDGTTIHATEYGQEVIDDLRALDDWESAIGAGTIEDPDNVMCLPNPSRIGRPGHCRFCGTPGGHGGCCD